MHCCIAPRRLFFSNLGYNSLSGSLPPSLGTSNNLQMLRVNNNLLSGQLSSDFGEHLNFTRTLGDQEFAIDLSMNSFCGLIPTGLGNITIASNDARVLLYVPFTGLSVCTVVVVDVCSACDVRA